MPTAFAEDQNIAESGALHRVGEGLASLGRGGYAAALTLSAVPAIFTGLLGQALSIVTLGGINGGSFGASALGFMDVFAPVAGLLAASGGVVKGIDAFKKGQKKKAVKEVIKGVAEGLFMGGLVLGIGMLASAVPLLSGVALPFMLLGAEPVTKMVTGKTITANFGEFVGTGLDMVMGETPEKSQTVQVDSPNVAQGYGPAVLQQGVAPVVAMPPQAQMAPVSMAGQPVMVAQPEMGQMVPNAAYSNSAVYAGMGNPMQMQQAAPVSTYHQDKLAASGYQRSGMGGPEAVRLHPAEAKQWTAASAAAADYAPGMGAGNG